MKSSSLFLSILGALCAGAFLTSTAAFAQATPEEQAKTILSLYEAGQKDSAYAMLEPLKKSARFVPAVIYTRAQMTPDDRALNLYKEILALDPGGTWSDKAAYQLVTRYADKRDSLAAYTWAGVLKNAYPHSSLGSNAEKILAEVTAWRADEEDLADVTVGKKPTTKPAATTKTSAKDGAKSTAKDGKPVASAKDTKSAAKDAKTTTAKVTVAGKPDAKKPADAKPDVKKASDDSAPTETFKSTGMSGYALQVGVFPTKDLAEARSEELRKRKIRAYALPKPSAGAGHYAVVIGPYTSKTEANGKKTTVNGLCGCQSFLVQVK